MHVRIRGVVQGVGFRFAARSRAASLGLSGWVRNDRDGSVEAVVEGPEDRVRAFVAWAHEGPAGALVDQVTAEPEPPRGEQGFRIVI